MKRIYLTTEDVAERYGQSVRSVHGLTAANRLPCRRLPGVRRVLFLADELDLYDDGAVLEVLEEGRVVRPKLNGAGS